MIWFIGTYWLELLFVLMPAWIVIFIALWYATGQHRRERP